MRSAEPKAFLLAVFFWAAVLPIFSASAAEEPMSGLGEVKARLTAIEEHQKEILAKEDRILAELDRIRIWVHRK